MSSRVMVMTKKKPEKSSEDPQKSSEDPQKSRIRRPVDLDLDLVPKVAMVAGALGMSIPSYVNNRLRTVVDAELPGILDAMGLGQCPKK